MYAALIADGLRTLLHTISTSIQCIWFLNAYEKEEAADLRQWSKETKSALFALRAEAKYNVYHRRQNVSQSAANVSNGPVVPLLNLPQRVQDGMSKSMSTPSLPSMVLQENRQWREPQPAAVVVPRTLHKCLEAQSTLVDLLMGIGNRLVKFKTKDIRGTQLHAELAMLNLSLPARLYIPSHGGSAIHHHIVRIPPKEATVLNSKDRVSCCVHVTFPPGLSFPGFVGPQLILVCFVVTDADGWDH